MINLLSLFLSDQLGLGVSTFGRRSSRTRRKGRVEVFFNDEWGIICLQGRTEFSPAIS